MKKHLFTFFIIWATCTVSAQIPQEPKNLQSPNIATLGLFGDIPVSHFTGTPSVDIPLHSIQDGDIEIQLSMSYHSSGIRPDQHPGWTGLGWGLQAGGAIYRVVNDMPDDYNNSRRTGANFGYYFNHNVLNTSRWNERSYLRGIAQDIKKFLLDTEPDEFNFSFLGYSGKFYLSHDGAWQVQCDKPLKVEFNGNFLDVPFDKSGTNATSYGYSPSFSGFTIYGEDGTAYIFGGHTSAIEYSMSFWDQFIDEWTASAWYLTKIVSPKKDEAVFEYERGDFTNQMYISVQEDLGSYTEADGFLHPECGPGNTTMIYDSYFGKLLGPVYLTSISTPHAKISFTRSQSHELGYSSEIYSRKYSRWLNSDRSIPFLPVLESFVDKYPKCLEKLKWYKLDEIEIENKDKLLMKKIKFAYSNTPSERLLLSSLIEESAGGGQKTYSFGYNQANRLPEYLSNQTDHWGFYNNIYASLGVNDYYSQREPNSSVMSYGVLNKITYPTGGYTRLIFEPHSYRKQLRMNRWEPCEPLSANKTAGGLRIKQIISSSSGNSEDEIVDKEYFYVTDYLSNGSNAGNSSGVLGGRIQYNFSNYIVYAFNDHNVRRKMNVFSSQSVLPVCSNAQGSHIGYSEVIERNSDGSFTQYRFTNFDNGHLDESSDAIIQESRTPYEPYASRECERGKPLTKVEYSSDGIKKYSKTYLYERSSNDFVRSMKASCKNVCGGTSVSYDEGTTYKIYTYVYRLQQEKDSTHNTSSSPVVITKNYSYNRYGLIREIAQTVNNGIKKFTYKRPEEFSTQVYSSMIACNILSPVVEESESLLTPSGTLLQLRKKRSNYVSVPMGPNRYYAISSIEDSISPSVWRKSYECSKFDIKANPVSVNINGKPVEYQWGYNKQYPVAIFENIRINDKVGKDLFYENFEENSNQTTLGFHSNYSYKGAYTVTLATNRNKSYTIDYQVFKDGKWCYTSADFKNGTYTINEGNNPIDDIRVYPKYAISNSFNYIPLIGLRSKTDEKGFTESYEYTSLGKLLSIKDNNQNSTEKYYYKYYNQNFEEDIYRNITIDTSSPGGDGTIKTVRMKYGELLPIPTPTQGYSFEGWYDGDTKITTVPNKYNITIKGKFYLTGLVVYVTLMNDHMDERECINIGYITTHGGEIPDYTIDEVYGVKTYAIMRQEGGYPPDYIEANAYDDNKFVGWYDKDKKLYSTDPIIDHQELDLDFEDGEHIYAVFTVRTAPSDKTHTITIIPRSSIGGSGGVIGFEPRNLKRNIQTLTVKDGDIVTIYAVGDEGNKDSDYGTAPWWYYIKGFYSENGTALEAFNDINKVTAEYSFTARSTKTIYVDFEYCTRARK